MVYVPSPCAVVLSTCWPSTFALGCELLVPMVYLSCRVFDGEELSSGCVENKNTMTYCIYIYAAVMLLPSLGDSVGVFLFGMLLLCCCCFSLKVFRLIFLQLLDIFLVNSFKPEIRLSLRGARFC